MLEIKPIMNSNVEDILAFKTCCSLQMNDQNLEIHLTNLGDKPLIVASSFELIGDFGVHRIENVTPAGLQTVLPGRTAALYCFMDDAIWIKSREIVFRDVTGHATRKSLSHKPTLGKESI